MPEVLFAGGVYKGLGEGELCLGGLKLIGGENGSIGGLDVEMVWRGEFE